MNLGRAAARSALLATASNASVFVISFVSTVVLAHLLIPRQFGIAAFATATAEFLFLIISWSVPTALVRATDEEIRPLFDTALIVLAVLSAAILFIAGVVAVFAWFFSGRVLALFILVVVIGRLYSSIGACFGAELERRLAYGVVSFSQLLAGLAAAAIAITSAFLGAGIWALALRELLINVIGGSVLIVASSWRPHWSFDRAIARDLLVFGWRMGRARIGDLMFHRYDNIVVGLVSGNRQLGFYSQAYLLADGPNRLYAPAAQQVTLAVYSRLQNDRDRQQEAFRLGSFLLTRALAPAGAVFIVLAPQILAVLFGRVWLPAAPMLRLLSVYAVLLPLFVHLREILIANGDIEAVIRARTIQLAVFLPMTPLLVLLYGGEGAAASVALGMSIGTVSMLRVARRWVVLAWRDITVPGLAGVLAAAAGFAVVGQLQGDLRQLLIGMVALLTVYAAILGGLDRRGLGEAFGALRGNVPTTR